jgi:hypothetical protein
MLIAAVCLLAAITFAAMSRLGHAAGGQQPIAGGRFEASGVVHVPDSDGVLFVDDGQARKIFWMGLSRDGAQRGPAIEVPLGAEVVDLEGITTDGSYIYAVGSQSKTVGVEGDGLVRFTFDPVRKEARQVESVRALKAFLARHVRELAGVERRTGDEALNIEGLAWDPTERRLLLGLRAPVVGGDALIVPLSLRDPDGPFNADNLKVDDGGALRLPLGGAGIRGIEFDPITERFMIITGAELNAETKDFRVLEWNSSQAAAPLREVRRYSRRLKPEGITRARLSGGEPTIVVFDIGSYESVR